MIFKANGRYLSQEIFRPQINSMNQTVMQIKLIFQKIFNFHQLILLYLQIWRWNMVSVQWQCDNEIVKSLGYAKRFGKVYYGYVAYVLSKTHFMCYIRVIMPSLNMIRT
ncbi:hypothetical protein ACKWTF_004389 [Chironomus riparius]